MRGSARTRWISVVFPAPDGDEMMKRSPGVMLTPVEVLARSSLNVLHLLLERLDVRLEVEDNPRGADLPDLRARRVDLPVELLRQVVEALPDRAVRRQEPPHLGE